MASSQHITIPAYSRCRGGEGVSEPWVCPMCGRETTDRGNNPAPLPGTRVCDQCNEQKVIPARINQRLDTSGAGTAETSVSESVKLASGHHIDLSGFVTVDDPRECLKAKPESLKLKMELSTSAGILLALQDLLLKIVDQCERSITLHECSPMPSTGSGHPVGDRLGECVDGGVESPMPDHPTIKQTLTHCPECGGLYGAHVSYYRQSGGPKLPCSRQAVAS